MRIHPSAVLLWGSTLAALCGFAAEAQEYTAPANGFTSASAASPDAFSSGSQNYGGYGYGGNGYGGSGPAGVMPTGGEAYVAPEAAAPAGAYPGYAGDASFYDASGAYCPPGAMGHAAYGYPATAYPPSTNAWPYISPYDHNFEQHYRKDGLWFNEFHNRGREYGLSLEYLRSNALRPGTDLVGNPDVWQRFPFDPLNPGFFPPHNVGVFDDNIDSGGLRGRFTIRNPDDSAFETQVWWVAESSDVWRPFPTGDIDDLTTIRSRGGLPLETLVPGGVTVPYDLKYDLFYHSSSWGADADWVSMPLVNRKNLKVRTMIGMKFLQIREQFGFAGMDSGLGYALGPDGRPIPDTITDIGLDPFESELTSRTTSYLAGPQIGLRYEMGGEGLRVWGSTKFAVAANREEAHLSGNQIGDPFTQPFPDPTPDDLYPAAFSDNIGSTHISPILDTSIFIEAPVFRHLPVFKRSPIFHDAKFRFGYTYILAGEVIRPTKIIVWQTENPELRSNHSRWSVGLMSFAIDWKF